MLAAFGLGNPGDGYVRTRHNLGKNAVISLIERLDLALSAGRGPYHLACDRTRELWLIVPATYVNASGIAALQALEALQARPDRLLAVCDDFNLPLGTIRIRKRGGDGGHNGLASVIYQLGTEDFPRLRLGVGPLTAGTDSTDFVLSEFGPDEEDTVTRLTSAAGEAILSVASEGIDKAMSMYNSVVCE